MGGGAADIAASAEMSAGPVGAAAGEVAGREGGGAARGAGARVGDAVRGVAAGAGRAADLSGGLPGAEVCGAGRGGDVTVDAGAA